MLTSMNPNDPGNTNGSGGGNGGGMNPNMPTSGDKPWGNGDPFASALLINYNERCKSNDPTLFRDTIIKQTIACLLGKNKPNAILVGAAGVGKTAIVEDIARRIATNDILIPKQLQGYTVWELPISNIICGSSYVGDVEAKTKSVIEFASDPANKVILFIDEIHLLVDSSHKEYQKVAQLLKPALARGDVRTIGATTLQESQNLMDDPAFNRRFTRVIVDELSQEQTYEILKKVAPSYIKHYNNMVDVNDQTCKLTVQIADTFKTSGSHRPDNALSLLDRTMAETVVKLHVRLENATRSGDTNLINSLPKTELVSKRQLTEVAMKLMTGSNEPINIDYRTLVNELSLIKGQNESLNDILETIQKHQLKISTDKKPLTFLFAGNSGVGKTEAAKILARHMTANEPIILNMTEFHSSSSINRIIGAPAGYVGYDSAGELPFDSLESNPYRIVLLDEFEKADASVQKLFMSAFDEGYIKTARGKVIDFSKTIIIATTNAGCEETSSNGIGFTNENTSTTGEAYRKILSRYFDIALLNRFTRILQFNPITSSLFKEILADKYKRVAKRVKATYPRYTFINDTLSDDVLNALADEHYSPLFGARHTGDIVQKYIEDRIIENTSPLITMDDAVDDDDVSTESNINNGADGEERATAPEYAEGEDGNN
jgi:ATP-dependent Clp protease ATP-binding subunit ClpB